MTTKALALALAVLVSTQLLTAAVSAFCSHSRQARTARPNFDQLQRTQTSQIFATNDSSDDDNSGSSSSYESSASVTKGLVSSLTSLTNNIFGGNSNKESTTGTAVLETSQNTPPTSPEELLIRIQKDYTQNNYLWTGNIDTSSFVSNCTFTDPTLSFVGVDKYVENVGNLVPIVEYALGSEQISNSTLLDITLEKEKGYIQTRWNMIGELNALFWKPKIDVIGRTKFWYQEKETNSNNNAVQVYFYDEEWEIPAGLALLQLVTPAGTIRRSDEERVLKT